VPL
jgi:hypothetical protein